MKLNYKRTFLVGLAFLSISAFWQLYDGVIPKILTRTFGLGESITGVFMAADNVLALFLLPLFGSLSDKCRSRFGRRMPFIVGGTLAAVILMNLLPLLDNRYFTAPSTLTTVLFVITLFLLLVAMSTYRSPAVALMPDVTPKPLRSKGNAVINLMGACGGILYLLVSSLLYSSDKVAGFSHVNYQPLFFVVSALMALSVLVLTLTIPERKLAGEVDAYEAQHPEENLEEVDEHGAGVLPKPVKKSLIFLLLSVALWYIGYNAITTWFTTYADEMWGMALGDANLCLTIAMAGAIVSYLPVGIIASRVGRKKSILFGVALLALSFGSCIVYTLVAEGFSPILYVVFVLVGVAWATINVNSLPMVVEMCRGSDTGKFTGYYYVFSMAAQVVTPIVAGSLMEHISYNALFPYATAAVCLAFVTMLFVHHGDNRVVAKRGLEAFEDLDA